jgi:DNA primase large subunit
MIDYSYYPILKGSLQHRHITEFDEQEIHYAFEHIEKYSPTKLLSLDLSVWLVSTIMLRCLNNNYVTRKFVANYGKTFESKLMKDFLNKEVRMEILQYFNIDKDILFSSVSKEPFVKIHIMEYLELLEKGLSIQAPQFQLANQILSKGYVYLEYARFIYLMRISLECRLFNKIKTMKEWTENKLINRCVKELDVKYPRFDKVQAPSKENIPYSIQELIDIAHRDHHLSHHQRIKLGIYLQKNHFSDDYIMDIFKQLSDFSEKTTRYQLQSLKRYIK